MSDKPDVYARVTAKIIADLERGTPTWRQPWQAGHPAGPVSRPLRAEGTPYRGINVMMLWASAMENGYGSPLWMTYRQAGELGGQVRKGEKGSLVVYASRFTATVAGEKGEAEEREIPFMKGYSVFNVEQIDGLPGHYYAAAPAAINPIDRLDAADRFFAATGATIRHGGQQAYYSPGQDLVQMPPMPSFHHQEGYYATLAHEMTHWTRHPSRLDRDLGRKRFGDAGYAMEELVAEIGSAYLCADLGITPETRPDHAAYIGSWLKVLRDDKRAIFTAASHADRATDHLHGYQPKEQAAERLPLTPTAADPGQRQPGYATPPMTIGNHEWRITVHPSRHGGQATSFEWRPPGGGWYPQQDWPRYDINDGMHLGLPKTLTKLYERHRGEIEAALKGVPYQSPQGDLFASHAVARPPSPVAATDSAYRAQFQRRDDDRGVER